MPATSFVGFRTGVSQLLIILEALVALPGGGGRADADHLLAGTLVAASVGAALAASLGGAGSWGELIVELFVALFL